MAERVGFEVWTGVENKEFADFRFLTIRSIRTKARVETRAEHADDAQVALLHDVRHRNHERLVSPLSLLR